MLTGKTNEEKIWNYLAAAGLTACGAAGLMGNLYAESGLVPANLQNTYEKKLGYTDATYTAAVDSGAYANFAKDGAGYGLAQWTYHTRKAALLAFAKAAGKSVGDLETQLAFLVHELESSFSAVLSALKTARTIEAASNTVLLKFERPANQGEAVKLKRVRYGQMYYDKYAKPVPVPVVMSAEERALRQKVVGIINGWVGATKGSAKHLDILAAYNGHKPLARGYKVQKNDAYCAATVSAAYIRAGIAEYTGTECGVEKFIAIAKTKGIWVENDAHVPGLGDACVYDWQDSGVGDCTGAGDHIGIVSAVGGDAFTVTEGNMSGGKVGTRKMRVDGRYIRGFICPDFAAIAKKVSNAPVEAIDKLAKLGVLNSPNYWKQAVASGEVWCLDLLLVKAARKISKAGPRSSTPENGIGALVAAGVIDTPEYWLAHYRDYPSLGALLCALGGAVK
ncbi:phage tail tip lysozyme [uncultured Oscillibacter sp.]|uniref:phage tail tip lysozyme n=1 Tax=uncultured Oscillibacter sp. TaxID=876091 RepID=UPI0025E87210|nr:phage tail tip lysozyme [uncultured Oscillibacter sp.]